MISPSIRVPTLATTLWNDDSWIRFITLAVAGAGLLTLSAKVQIPFVPVPMTMQTFVVLVLGMSYGPTLGGSTVLLYLVLGSAGLPVFAGTPEKGIGLAYMIGPTGGYLIGFVLAAMAVGYLAERGWDRKMVPTFLAMLIGNILIYVPGLLWLGNVVGWDKPVLEWGLTPFIFGDLVKIVLAMLVIPAAWKVIGKRH